MAYPSLSFLYNNFVVSALWCNSSFDFVSGHFILGICFHASILECVKLASFCFVLMFSKFHKFSLFLSG